MLGRKKTWGLAAAAIVCFVAAIQLRARAVAIFHDVRTVDDRYYLPSADWVRVFSLGFTEAASDLIWIKTLLYFGSQWDKKAGVGPSRFTMNYLSTAASLDPKFKRLYTAGSTLTLFQNRGQVSEETVNMAIELLELGTKAFPNDGKIYFDLGYMHYYEMWPFIADDPKSEKARYHKETGVRLIRASSLMPGSYRYAASLVPNLMDKEGMGDLIVEHLKAQLVVVTDPEIRAGLVARLRRELGKAAERDIRTTWAFQQAWRSEFPYIPFDLYLLLRHDHSIEDVIDPLARGNRLLIFDPPETIADSHPQSQIPHEQQQR